MIVGAGLAIGVGVYLGEEVRTLWPPAFLGAMVAFVCLGVLLTPAPFPSRLVGGVMLLLPLVSGFVAGRYEGTTAFQESVDRAPAVQEALGAYQSSHGSFPERLEALRDIELPGRRLIRGRILNYQKTDTGYRLMVERWALLFVGDESHPLAHVPLSEEKTP